MANSKQLEKAIDEFDTDEKLSFAQAVQADLITLRNSQIKMHRRGLRFTAIAVVLSMVFTLIIAAALATLIK